MSGTIDLTLGHSPDPDDAFMFYALAKDKIDTGPYRFTHVMEDIQTLNERATRGELDITAISIHAYAYVLDKAYLEEPQFQRYIAARADHIREAGFDTDIWGYESFHD